MYDKLLIVKVDSKYCDYLRKFDSRVVYNKGIKELRPFIGILFIIDKCEYFAPLSSPKEKHKSLKNTLDLLKIDDGNLGVINLNNMIPVTSKNYEEFDFNKQPANQSERFRIKLLTNQLRWLTSHKQEIRTKSKLLYTLYKNKKLKKNVEDRCCNYMLLEDKCRDFNN